MRVCTLLTDDHLTRGLKRKPARRVASSAMRRLIPRDEEIVARVVKIQDLPDSPPPPAKRAEFRRELASCESANPEKWKPISIAPYQMRRQRARSECRLRLSLETALHLYR